jgi:hypothetical protein
MAQARSAQEDEAGDDEMMSEFEESHVFFELNNTDNDLGIHAMVDGGPWTSLEIVTPEERLLMTVRAAGPLWHQQVTELFFESEEPPFDELSPQSSLNDSLPAPTRLRARRVISS